MIYFWEKFYQQYFIDLYFGVNMDFFILIESPPIAFYQVRVAVANQILESIPDLKLKKAIR